MITQVEKSKKLLKPKIDVVFHALFREENKRLTEGLITDIIGQEVKIKTTDLNRHLDVKVAEQKLGIMDLRSELEDGTKCNIEIQLDNSICENERFLYYWSDAYSRQLLRGKEYEELRKTISIIILGHEIKELEGIKDLGVKWQIRDNVTGKRLLTEHLEIIIIEIPKAIKQYSRNNTNKISEWMMFLEDPNKEEVEEIMEKNEKIKEAVEELKGMSEDEELRILAELREKGRRDYNAGIKYATKKGEELGEKRGEKRGEKIGEKRGEKRGRVQIAQKMLEEKINIDTIIRLTGLKRREVEMLKN